MESKDETEPSNKFEKRQKMASEEFWQNFIYKAPLEPAFDFENGQNLSEVEAEAKADVIESIDPELIKNGQDFFEKNFPLMMFSLIATALLGFSIKSTTAVLMRNSDFLVDPKLSIARNLRTLWHVFRWHTSDFSMERAVEKMFVVRRIHRLVLKKVSNDWSLLDNYEKGNEDCSKVAEAIRKDLEFVDSSNLPSHLFSYDSCGVPMSQFNLVCTQASGYAFMKAYPKAFGFKDSSGMDGLGHLWGVVGKAMGIKDVYNLTLHDDDEEEGELSRRYVQSIALGGFKACDTATIVIHKCILEGLAHWFPLWVSHKGMMHMCFSAFSPQYEGKNLKKLMTWADYLWVLQMKTALYLIANFQICRWLAQSIHRWYIDAAFYKYLGQGNAKVLSPIS